MPALAEEAPAENERGAEKEVGIDCPPEFKVFTVRLILSMSIDMFKNCTVISFGVILVD